MSGAPTPEVLRLRVQVVELEPAILELELPSYLPAGDLTQRIARDAGLPAFQGGRRRRYWLHARGRLVDERETLASLGVGDGELLYLLPEPPPGSGVVERSPEPPPPLPGRRSALLHGGGSLGLALLWALAWGAALQVSSAWVALLPGLGLGLLCTAAARYLWPGPVRLRVLATAAALLLLLAPLGAVAPLLAGRPAEALALLPGLFTGLAGVLLGWVAWWGSVEPLAGEAPVERAPSRTAPEAELPRCALCGQPVSPEVRLDCPHGCGRVFHRGCYQARAAVYRGPEGRCPVCGEALPARSSPPA